MSSINISESLKQIHLLLDKADSIYGEYPNRRADEYDGPEMQIEYCLNNAFIFKIGRASCRERV